MAQKLKEAGIMPIEQIARMSGLVIAEAEKLISRSSLWNINRRLFEIHFKFQ